MKCAITDSLKVWLRRCSTAAIQYITCYTSAFGMISVDKINFKNLKVNKNYLWWSFKEYYEGTYDDAHVLELCPPRPHLPHLLPSTYSNADLSLFFDEAERRPLFLMTGLGFWRLLTGASHCVNKAAANVGSSASLALFNTATIVSATLSLVTSTRSRRRK